MSLSDYTATQMEAINKLLKKPNSPLHTPNFDLPDWEGFRKSFWGPNSAPFQEEIVERGDEPVHCDPLPITHSTLTLTPPESILREWASRSRKVLVRDEYEETRKAAELAHDKGRDIFVVAGHPHLSNFVNGFGPLLS